MNSEIVLYILFAGVIAFTLALFMYGYNTKYTTRQKVVYTSLRFLSLWVLFVLLINPKLTTNSYYFEKAKLPVLIDNSMSISELEKDSAAISVVNLLKNNKALQDKFDVSFYKFGSGFQPLDSLSFQENNTSIFSALQKVKSIFADKIAPTIIITDGNQTLGLDYEYASTSFSNTIYPIILGDSIAHIDIKIDQVSTNKYSFLKNSFPVELTVLYTGNSPLSTTLYVKKGANTVYSTPITFSENTASQTVSFTLPSQAVGIQKYRAYIPALAGEKNISNNERQFAVEVIDQSTNVLVVSAITHPDIGALKRAIASNEQRAVTVVSPDEALLRIDESQAIILYQPDRSFQSVFAKIENENRSSFIITGTETDWNFLNRVQQKFEKETTRQTEEVTAKLSSNFGVFSVDDIGFESFPPLKTSFGMLEAKGEYSVLLDQYIEGIYAEAPTVCLWSQDGVKTIVWDGEGHWRWRAQSFVQENSFESYDTFIGQLIQFLADAKQKTRLDVDFQSFYYNNKKIELKAQYFDANYNFDPEASLTLHLVNKETQEETILPMLLRNFNYGIALNDLPGGDYSFTVKVAGQNISKSGEFTLLNFNVEKQFLNANVTKLQRLATNTNAEAYFVSDANNLITFLLNENQYKPIQKSTKETIPLVSWKYLLGIFIFLVSLEWFLRKYNGLI